MRLHDPGHEAQAQPQSLNEVGFGVAHTIEAVKDVRQAFHRDAHAGVLNFDAVPILSFIAQVFVLAHAHLNGAADSGKYDHIDTAIVLKHVRDGDIFAFLSDELGSDVEYALVKLTDVHRHVLLGHWRAFATGYEPYQFHVRRSGLLLLVAYLLHLIGVRQYQIPQ